MSDYDLTGIVGEELKSGQDYIFNGTDLPNNTTLDSAAFKYGKVQGGIQLHVNADADITVTGTVTIQILGSDTEDGVYTLVKELVQYGAGVIAEGEMANDIPDDSDKVWAKVRVITTEDLQAYTMTSYITQVER